MQNFIHSGMDSWLSREPNNGNVNENSKMCYKFEMDTIDAK